MIRAVTFDAANTLIEHSWDPARLAVDSAKSFGLPLNDSEARIAYHQVYTQMRGEHELFEKLGDENLILDFWKRLIEAWLSKLELDKQFATSIVNYCQNEVYSKNSPIWRLFSDVRPTLFQLSSMEIRVGVISNWDRSLLKVLENLEVSDCFEFVIASLVFGCEKPETAIFHEAARRLELKPDEILHVGDSINDDVEGAKRAGFEWLHLDRSLPTDFGLKRINSLCDVLEVIQ